ncbi:DUF3748 domain-containing protein [Niabella terrae]
MSACLSDQKNSIRQLTHQQSGHTLHHNGVFSSDGRWVVFDGRNHDTAIGQTTEIGMVDIQTGELRVVYRTAHPTEFGPGVGAASFSPVANTVIFIHGLVGANQAKPYGFTRRTGVAVELSHPRLPIHMDARDLHFPYTPGSLRGGTHSHCWSPDGRLISFTYNDDLVEPDLRTVGLMLDAGNPVRTDALTGNNNGLYYAVVVADVVAEPEAGSDQIGKAFDECWLGREGYINQRGEQVPYAIAFQGNTVDRHGQIITEIYLVDIDTAAILRDSSAVGSLGQRPQVPVGLQQRRLSRSLKGLSSVRHWLRSSPDGRYIYALAEDDRGLTQLIRCEVATGKLDYLTRNAFSITNPFNSSPDGTQIVFVANNNIYLLELSNLKVRPITHMGSGAGQIVGAPGFSPDGQTIIFNQYLPAADQATEYLQILAVKLGKPTQ